MKVNHRNILTNFSEITNTTKRFYYILRLDKKMYLAFWSKGFPQKGKYMKKHKGIRMKVKEWICRTEEHNFLWINICTNTDFTNAGPFLPFIILFSLFVQDDAKQTQDEAGDMASIYATLSSHKSLVYPETTLYILAPQEFPNSENPALQCNMTWNVTKRNYCIIWKFSPICTHFKYKTNTKPHCQTSDT